MVLVWAGEGWAVLVPGAWDGAGAVTHLQVWPRSRWEPWCTSDCEKAEGMATPGGEQQGWELRSIQPCPAQGRGAVGGTQLTLPPAWQ